jgi:serine/threonine-protein kinase
MVAPNQPALRSTIGWSQGKTLPLPEQKTMHWGPASADHARPIEPELERPRVLGFDQRYRFERLLGEGGMGRVALHEDQQIGRRVAIKQLLVRYRDDGAAERRFLREARIQAQLEHPAVVPVYDLGVDAEAQLYTHAWQVQQLLPDVEEREGS